MNSKDELGQRVQTSKPFVFDPLLVKGRLLKRYKRFFADVRLSDGSVVTAHCGNTGRMTGLLESESTVWLQYRGTKGRKLAWSWELASQDGRLVGVNTTLPNRLVHDAIMEGFIPQIAGYREARREVKLGHSRLDIALGGHPEDPRRCVVEVKNVTLAQGSLALFPDSVTKRGLKHLSTLSEAANSGMRAIQFYLVQRMDCEVFAPAWAVDPSYAQGLVDAQSRGVEIIAYEARILPGSIALVRELPVDLRGA